MPLVDDLEQTVSTVKRLQVVVDALLVSVDRITVRLEALEKTRKTEPDERS
jgi:hypothetical protein